jgi:hypothetical protein
MLVQVGVRLICINPRTRIHGQEQPRGIATATGRLSCSPLLTPQPCEVPPRLGGIGNKKITVAVAMSLDMMWTLSCF